MNVLLFKGFQRVNKVIGEVIHNGKLDMAGFEHYLCKRSASPDRDA